MKRDFYFYDNAKQKRRFKAKVRIWTAGLIGSISEALARKTRTVSVWQTKDTEYRSQKKNG